ncbi:MAG: hypothetical protein FH751_08380 [Firmicutes bacterium]|nr:hypothetical protein [Bacillota bacterium]
MLVLLSNLKILVCITIMAVLIKVLDDYYDGDYKNIEIIKNLEESLVLYGLLAFSIACVIESSLAITFFISAYIIGMFKDFNRKLTLGLKGYQEGILLIILCLVFINPLEVFSSFLIILIIDITDDILDFRYDKKYNKKNYVLQFGLGEVLITAIILILFTIKLDYVKLIYSLLIFFTLQLIENGGIPKWI